MAILPSKYPSVPIPSQSLWTYLFTARQLDPNLTAFIDAPTGRTLSRAQLRALTLQVAYGVRNVLPQETRLSRGDTAMIFSPNSLAFPVVILGLIANGSRATLANSAYTSQELAHQYTDSRSSVVFAHPSLVDTARAMFKLVGVPDAEARKRLVVMDLDSQGQDGIIGLGNLLAHGSLPSEENFDGELAHETVLLCYSSGTTGKPKGVETTHRNLVSVLAMIEPLAPVMYPGKDVMLAVLPYYHIYGVVKLLFYELLLGVATAIMPKFNPEEFCQSIERYGVTVTFIVPPIVLALVHHPAVLKYNIKTLTYISSGAAPIGPDMVTAAMKRLASVGAFVDIGQGYGLTETSPVTHLVPRADARRKVGTIGPLLPNLEARLVIAEREDGEALEDAAPGTPGEIWVRGPSVMKGYLNNSTATRNAITPSGWFKTGDIAIIDDEGFYTIVDRKKELIKYKNVLLQHPDIVDAAVIGIEDPSQATELPRYYLASFMPISPSAYVVHRDGTQAAPSTFPRDIQAWIETRVAKHKFLRGGVVVIDVIPKSAAGKILRRELRTRAAEELKSEVKVKAKL
ncbi:AMP binding protein [Amylostereum chailletii]|nr:AMP binding protein [Amylostereum chailletii]